MAVSNLLRKLIKEGKVQRVRRGIYKRVA
jgi:hypothetical protein